ncbi:MAG: helix-hairpin-helix domain-containing protein [Acidobacteriaceae bacterium]|nr:helix-hairpin-helix domain-containing protein [Acidobacteriaceae bacterium]
MLGAAVLLLALLPQQPAPESAGGVGKLDLNTATAAQLASLPGMGREYVRRVLNARPYIARNQLITKGILPQAEYDRIKDLVIAHRTPTGAKK